jgi:hypothetical protein
MKRNPMPGSDGGLFRLPLVQHERVEYSPLPLPSIGLGVWSTPSEYFRGGTLLLSNESVDGS